MFVGTTVSAATCRIPFNTVLETIKKSEPTSTNKPMTTQQSKVFMKAYNDGDPKTTFIADMVVAFTKPNEPELLFLIVNKMCLVSYTKMTQVQFLTMMGGVTK